MGNAYVSQDIMAMIVVSTSSISQARLSLYDTFYFTILLKLSNLTIVNTLYSYIIVYLYPSIYVCIYKYMDDSKYNNSIMSVI